MKKASQDIKMYEEEERQKRGEVTPASEGSWIKEEGPITTTHDEDLHEIHEHVDEKQAGL